MADMEKVQKGLECCADGTECSDDCPYRENCCDEPMFVDLAKDALELLKSQKDALEQMRLDNQDLRQCNSEMREEIDRLKAYVPIPSIADTPIYCSDGKPKDGDADV